MVFGYYTIPLKTLTRQELPPNLQVEPGVEIQMGMKVAHVIFIPFFPLGKNWIMKKGGQSYSITPQAEQMFDQAYGRPKTPFYAFLGPILLVLGFFYMQYQDSVQQQRSEKYAQEYAAKQAAEKERQAIENAQEYKEDAEKMIASINTPSELDYFSLTTEFDNTSEYDGTYSAKIKSIENDYVILQFAPEVKIRKHSSKNDIIKPFVLLNYPFKEAKVAKQDLINTVNTDLNNLNFKGVVIEGLADNMPLQVRSHYRLNIDSIRFQIQDEQITKEVTEGINNFLTNGDIELLDQASKDYLIDIISLAKKKDEAATRGFINQSNAPSCDYSLLMYAQYSYLNSDTDSKPKSTKELLTMFGFYTKLIGIGLWSIDEHVKKAEVKKVYLTAKNEARVEMKLRANILETKREYNGRVSGMGMPSMDMIDFTIKLSRENGIWKVNLPSTWAYTEKQIKQVGRYGNSYGRKNEAGEKEYRQMVRNQLKAIDPTIDFDNWMVY